MISVDAAPVRDVKGTIRKALSEAHATRKRAAILPKKLKMKKVEKHLLAFGFQTGGDIEKIEIGGEGYDTDLGKVQHQLPIDCARFSRWPGQQHRDCGRY